MRAELVFGPWHTELLAKHPPGSRLRLASAIIAFVLSGCSNGGLELVVDVRTDWLAGREFIAVRTTLVDEGREEEASAFESDDYLSGVRVAELQGLAPGAHLVRVELVGGGGDVIAQRPVSIQLSTDLAAIVVITRDCRDVVCSGALSACLNGVCVDPRCSDAAPEFCPVACETVATCATTGVECVEPLCVDGACYQRANDARCAGGASCSFEAGCVGGVDGGGVDAGLDAGLDAGFRYAWVTGGFGSCSRGFRSRSVTCERSDAMTVEDALCTETMPERSQGCAWTEDYGSGEATTARMSGLEPSDNGNCQPGCAPPCTGTSKPVSECRDLCRSLAESEGRRFICAHTACGRSCRVFGWQSQSSIAGGLSILFAGYPPGDSG